MYKILATKPAKVLLVTLVTLLLSVQIVSAQGKPTLNKTILLENKVELPSNNITVVVKFFKTQR